MLRSRELMELMLLYVFAFKFFFYIPGRDILMIKQPKYLIKFANAQNDNGTVWYTIDVYFPKEEEHWTFKERFSHMRDLHINCEKSKFKNQLPVFPPRKLFGSTEESFIQKRKKQLENYYNTLFKTVSIDEFPELLQFFNTNKPKKLVSKPTSKSPEVDNSPSKFQKPDKQVMLKKMFEDIVARTKVQMVESTEYDTDIEDETRRKFNQEFQKLKLDLKAPLIDKFDLPKGDKQNDTDYWNQFFHDTNQEKMNKIDKLSEKIDKIVRESRKCKLSFVVAL